MSWKKKEPILTPISKPKSLKLFNYFFKKYHVVADFLTDFPFFVPFLSILIALIGIVLGFVYFTKTFKAKAVVDKQNYKLQLESAADKKRMEEISLAKELKEDNKRLALDVKEAMIHHVSTIVNTLKSDIELQKTILLSEIALMKKDYSQVRTDMLAHIENQQTINERMQKSIDFMNQFLWGAGARSTPEFLNPEDIPESEEHKTSPTVGIFTEPDSTETKKFKDEHGGTTTTDDIAKAKAKEKEKEKEKEKDE